MVNVLVGDLNEDAASSRASSSLRKQQPIAQICEVRVDAELPGVPERLDHLGFLGQVLVRRGPSLRACSTNGWKFDPYSMP